MRPLAGLRPGQQELVLREAMRVCERVCDDSLLQDRLEAFQLDPRGFPPHVQQEWILRFGTLDKTTFDAGGCSVTRDATSYHFEWKAHNIWKQLSLSKLEPRASASPVVPN